MPASTHSDDWFSVVGIFDSLDKFSNVFGRTCNAMLIAEIIVYTVAAYLAAGFLFALYFVGAGADKLDESARGAGIFFRLVILPGATALLPRLAWRLVRLVKPKLKQM